MITYHTRQLRSICHRDPFLLGIWQESLWSCGKWRGHWIFFVGSHLEFSETGSVYCSLASSYCLTLTTTTNSLWNLRHTDTVNKHGVPFHRKLVSSLFQRLMYEFVGWVLSDKVSIYHLRSHSRQGYSSQHMVLLSFHVILPQCLLWSLDNLLLVSQARQVPASECLYTLFSLLEKRIYHFFWIISTGSP